MKLIQAIKEKKRLTADIQVIKQRIQRNNQISEGDARDYEIQPLLEELINKTKELIELKLKIQTANLGIYPKIFEMAEIKGEISFLNSIPCKTGKEISGYNDKEIVYISTINRKELDKTISEKTKQIRQLQDEIDIYNHTTEV